VRVHALGVEPPKVRIDRVLLGCDHVRILNGDDWIMLLLEQWNQLLK